MTVTFSVIAVLTNRWNVGTWFYFCLQASGSQLSTLSALLAIWCLTRHRPMLNCTRFVADIIIAVKYDSGNYPWIYPSCYCSVVITLLQGRACSGRLEKVNYTRRRITTPYIFCVLILDCIQWLTSYLPSRVIINSIATIHRLVQHRKTMRSSKIVTYNSENQVNHDYCFG